MGSGMRGFCAALLLAVAMGAASARDAAAADPRVATVADAIDMTRIQDAAAADDWREFLDADAVGLGHVCTINFVAVGANTLCAGPGFDLGGAARDQGQAVAGTVKAQRKRLADAAGCSGDEDEGSGHGGDH